MNNIALNSIINKLYASTVRVIDSITLTPDDVSFDMLTDTLVISCNGTITMNGYLWDVEELDKLPEVVRMVIRKFVIALRDGEVQGDHPELELISNNKEFFLDHEDAFVPAGLLCAAGIVDEHNMPTE